MVESLLLREPSIGAPLAPEFRPAYLGNLAFEAAVAQTGQGIPLVMALERNGGRVARSSALLLPPHHPQAADNLRYVERLMKMLLWQKGGFRVWVFGPEEVAGFLRATYQKGGEREFDAEFMARVYEQPAFEVRHVLEETDLPPESEQPAAIGGHLEGCRIGFDAGGSDRKVA